MAKKYTEKTLYTWEKSQPGALNSKKHKDIV